MWLISKTSFTMEDFVSHLSNNVSTFGKKNCKTSTLVDPLNSHPLIQRGDFFICAKSNEVN